MSNEFIPTTEQVENGFAHDSEDEYHDPVSYPANVRMRRRDFQRWLAQVKAEAQVEALRGAAAAFNDRGPSGEGNGRAHNSYTVARILRAVADRIAREAGIETGESDE